MAFAAGATRCPEPTRFAPQPAITSRNYKADCRGKNLSYFRTGAIRHFTYYVTFNWGL